MWLLGVVVRRYIDFLILLIPTPLVSVLFYSSIPTFCSFFKMFLVLYIVDNSLCSVFSQWSWVGISAPMFHRWRSLPESVCRFTLPTLCSVEYGLMCTFSLMF